MYSRIKGTGSYLPLTVRTNADLEKMVDTSDEWITTRTGIHERRIAGEGDTCAHMAVEASRKAIEASGVSAEDIDLVIAATTSSEYACPSVACLVQKELGLRQVPAFDLAAACSGFVYGLVTADSFIKSGNARTVLVIGVDAMHHAGLLNGLASGGRTAQTVHTDGQKDRCGCCINIKNIADNGILCDLCHNYHPFPLIIRPLYTIFSLFARHYTPSHTKKIVVKRKQLVYNKLCNPIKRTRRKILC